MAEVKTENQNQVMAFDQKMSMAKSVKDLFEIPDVKTRSIKGYEATTGKKDGEHKFQQERHAYLEIIHQKPELRGAPMWCHFKVINKVMNNGWSLRDNRIYLQVVKREDNIVDIKVDPSPAVRREMMELMSTVKEAPEAQVVVKGDVFVEDKLNHRVLEHRGTDKSLPADKLENITHSYQRILYKDGSIKDVVVPQFDLIKAKSKSKIKGDGGVWEWVAEACKKVATNRAFRLYHKYPDNTTIIDEVEDETVDTSHQDVTYETHESKNEHVDESTGEVTVTQEARVVDKPEKEKKQYNLLDD